MTELEEVTTPVRPTIFSPSTPPATGHTTRASTKKATLKSSSMEPSESVEPISSGPRGKKISPFDGWARTKGGIGGVGKGKKRAAEVMKEGEDAGGNKKAKGNEVV